MNKVLAVAILDLRRLGFGLVTVALVAGLIPSLASGIGGDVPIGALLRLAFFIVGLIAGGCFGGDFAEGKGSFFFARPLPSGVLIAGRLVALSILAFATFVSMMASNWVSTSDRSVWRLAILDEYHFYALATGWSLSLSGALAISARGRELQSKWRLRDYALAPFSMALNLLVWLVPFGLFADLMVRAYSSPKPAKILFASFVIAAFATSCLAITAGRTDRSRITRFQNLGIFSYIGAAFCVIVAAWAYVLHPGSDAIERVLGSRASADGRSAYVLTTVDRGDPRQFNPLFSLDIASGQASLLKIDQHQGLWTSADGGTVVWSDTKPHFFRPLWRYLGGEGSLRVTSAGKTVALPLPEKVAKHQSSKLGFFPGFETLGRVLPSSNGEVFAMLWNRLLLFTSRSRGDLSELDLVDERVIAMAFLPSGELRAATSGTRGSNPVVSFKDIDPGTGHSKLLGSVEVGHNASVRFDAKTSRALVSSRGHDGRTTLSLVDLSGQAGGFRSSVVVENGLGAAALFLADGRVAAMSGGRDHGPLKILDSAGALLREAQVGEGIARLFTVEMFEGVVPVALSQTAWATPELLFLDAGNGSIVRRVPGRYYPQDLTFPGSAAPPPGSVGARLLLDGARLYELPSLTAEPRLLLPLSKP